MFCAYIYMAADTSETVDRDRASCTFTASKNERIQHRYENMPTKVITWKAVPTYFKIGKSATDAAAKK